MKRLILILMLAGLVPAFGETYTEFYINNAGGDNLNSGHTSEATATYGTTGCNWTNDTSATVGTIYKSGLGAAATAVTNGAFASIFPDGTTGATPFVGMVVTNDSTKDTIQISLVNKGGTKPASSTGATSIRVGGAWKGPGTYDGLAGHPETNTFPLALINGAMTNNPQVTPCINWKSGTTYSITNTCSLPNAGSYTLVIAGYKTNPRDGGARAILDGGTAYPGYVLMTINGSAVNFQDMEFSNNGNSGTSIGVNSTGSGNRFLRCLFHDLRGNGLQYAGGIVDQCEAYNCDLGSGSNTGGFKNNASGTKTRFCVSHDNGSVGDGFVLIAGTVENCISYNNGGHGIEINVIGTPEYALISNCSVYSNGLAGVSLFSATPMEYEVQNSLFVKNKGCGITNSFDNIRHLGRILNCGFGSGTQANVAGDISANTLPSAFTNGNFTLPTDQSPWTDALRGNFSLTSTQAKAAGYGIFLQTTVNSPTNTVAYIDLGAAQAASTNSGGGEHSHVFAQ